MFTREEYLQHSWRNYRATDRCASLSIDDHKELIPERPADAYIGDCIDITCIARYCRHREDARDINSRVYIRRNMRKPVVRVYYMNATPFVFRPLFLQWPWLYCTRGIISAVRFERNVTLQYASKLSLSRVYTLFALFV